MAIDLKGLGNMNISDIIGNMGNQSLTDNKAKTKVADNQVVIFLEPEAQTVHYFAMTGTDKGTIKHHSAEYTEKTYSEEFYEKLTEIVAGLCAKESFPEPPEVTILLPDSAVFTSTFSLPSLSGAQMKQSAKNSINGAYKNRNDLTVVCEKVGSVKQNVFISSVGVQNSILNGIKYSCTANNLNVCAVTYESNGIINAIGQLVPKHKNSTYLYLDIQENYTRVIYVIKGRSVAFSTLPYGYSLMDEKKVEAENMLYDHDVAELAVVNAKEKAKAKQLSMGGGNNAAVEEGEDNEDGEEDPELAALARNAAAQKSAASVKVLPKKQPRKLPKFMLREEPETPEGIAYENFRNFIKRALTFLYVNTKLTQIEKPEAVYVSMPEDLDYLYEMTNAEEQENGIKFLPVGTNSEADIILDNIEMYGALFAQKMNVSNNF